MAGMVGAATCFLVLFFDDRYRDQGNLMAVKDPWQHVAIAGVLGALVTMPLFCALHQATYSILFTFALDHGRNPIQWGVTKAVTESTNWLCTSTGDAEPENAGNRIDNFKAKTSVHALLAWQGE
eukprot:CAMPEP_0195110102 /NCGR_PEP_ID=MMETSP0448-20130528/91547_1 /TAXON_ID=66468 /ORGANISM="Heterocapsa triquestra, Strain CCMP 448" /LENGTH=123 /DNA_ID=CAMNT_0040146771 /DNA_START=44 /DNA_END=413 /DNA_ORIENTATION=+